MSDRELLRFYLRRGSPEAQRWNLSVDNLAAELACRRFLLEHVRPSRGMRACNIGIGVGEWDDFLGYWLESRAQATSIDKDRRSCDMLRYRQRREKHPNPCAVLCRDILHAELPWGRFDLVTMIGSTARESGGYEAALASCLKLLKDFGRLLYMDFSRFHKPRDFLAAVRDPGIVIEAKASARTRRGADFFLFLARKKAASPGRHAP